MKGERGRVGGLSKQEPLSLAVIMCVRAPLCVCVCMCICVFICGYVSAHFVSCPLRLKCGQTAKWFSDGWPGLVVADTRGGRGRLAKWADRTSATDQHTDWPYRTRTAWGSNIGLTWFTWSASHRMSNKHRDIRVVLRQPYQNLGQT